MDYSSYYTTTPQRYVFGGLPSKQEHPYTPQEDLAHDPIDTYSSHHPYNLYEPSPYHYMHNQMIVHPTSPPQSVHSLPLPSGSQPPLPPPAIVTAAAAAAAPAAPAEGTSSPQHEVHDSNSSDQNDQNQGGRSSDEEKDNVTPAQNRRKAQNRAAQRAFRERKERHVKELEIKLKSIEAQSSTLLTDNERLKRELEKLSTQNEILRASNSLNMAHINHNSHAAAQQSSLYNATTAPPPPDSPISGPQTYSPSTTFHTAQSLSGNGSHRLHTSETTGERLLSTNATWDLIYNHEMFRKGMVDVGELCERLKDRAICDGTGPAFTESEIKKAIEDSVAGAGDELIWLTWKRFIFIFYGWIFIMC